MKLSAKQTTKRMSGFTVVELLIVIVVIGIIAAIAIVGYNSVASRSAIAKRDNDVALLSKAILAARQNTGLALRYITLSAWSVGSCSPSSGNPGNVEPRELDTTHPCWVRYYAILDNIGQAARIDLTPLRAGDARGNPYMLDENEGENCGIDTVFAFTGNGAAVTSVRTIPRLAPC